MLVLGIGRGDSLENGHRINLQRLAKAQCSVVDVAIVVVFVVVAKQEHQVAKCSLVGLVTRPNVSFGRAIPPLLGIRMVHPDPPAA